MTPEHEMAVEIAKEIAKQVPLKQAYDDLASPSMRQLGGTLEDLIKCVRLVGFPIQWLAVQQDRFRSFIEKAKEPITTENLILPAPQVLAAILEGMRFEIDDSEIFTMFQNLLSSAMDVEKVNLVHPSFAGIIKNLSRDGAKILQYLCSNGIKTIDVAPDVLHIGLEAVVAYQVDEIDLIFPNNVNFYMDRLFTLGLLGWEHRTFGAYGMPVAEKDGSVLKLSNSGRMLMSACRLMP